MAVSVFTLSIQGCNYLVPSLFAFQFVQLSCCVLFVSLPQSGVRWVYDITEEVYSLCYREDTLVLFHVELHHLNLGFYLVACFPRFFLVA